MTGNKIKGILGQEDARCESHTQALTNTVTHPPTLGGTAAVAMNGDNIGANKMY